MKTENEKQNPKHPAEEATRHNIASAVNQNHQPHAILRTMYLLLEAHCYRQTRYAIHPVI